MTDYSTTSEQQLALLSASADRRVDREVRRVCDKDQRFAQALDRALEIDHEIERREAERG